MSISADYGFYLSALLFSIGLLIIIIKRNVIFVLMGIELILNAANLNFVIFSRTDTLIQGEMMAIFGVVIAAAEAAVALGIVLLLVKRYKTSDLDQIDELRY